MRLLQTARKPRVLVGDDFAADELEEQQEQADLEDSEETAEDTDSDMEAIAEEISNVTDRDFYQRIGQSHADSTLSPLKLIYMSPSR